LEKDIAGYAQMPGGPEETDGIVVNSKFFAHAGAPVDGMGDYALGRTLAHLMGSYLNLHELWNEAAPCADDYVDDTPIHNAPNHGNGTYKHVSTCEGNPVEMTTNLMDSGNDSTMYLFTHGQAFRMQAALAEGGPRFTLTQTPTGCATDGGNLVEGASRSQSPTAVGGAMLLRTLPNPNNGAFTIEVATTSVAASEISVQLYDGTGRLVWSRTHPCVPDGTVRFPFEGQRLGSGIYVLKAMAGSSVQVMQVVVR
jgi:hypothetical protein